MKRLMKLKYIAVIGLLFSSVNSYGQCSLSILATADTIYCGQTVEMIGQAFGSTPVLSEDFNGGTLGPGWSSSIAIDYTNPCDPSPDGTPYAWLGNTVFPRILTTAAFDLSCGAEVCFDLDFSTQGGASPCEGPDLLTEGVYFQYSTDGGSTWIDIFYFEPAAGGVGGPYNTWANYCFILPPGAMSPSTMLQWNQQDASGAGNDHWGIDNVEIVPYVCGPLDIFDWSHVPGSNDNVAQTVNTDSTATYYLSYTDGVDTCYASHTIYVIPTEAEVTASSTNLICPNCTDLEVEFTNYNSGSIIDDFDPVNGTMWSDIQGGTASNACGSIAGNALRFDGPGVRSATTVGVDATAGCGLMSFSMIIGNSGSGGTCGNAGAGENVLFEYSTDGGLSWNLITTYFESSWDINNGWQSFFIPLAPAAQTPNTMFRWSQPVFNNASGDNWAIDNVSFVCNPPAFDFSWSPSVTLDDATIQTPQACPLDTTTYIATITDPATGCFATDSITINVSCNCMFSGLTADVSACENGNTFTVSGEFIYIENPTTGTIEIEVTNASGTYTQTIPGPFTDLTLTNYSIGGIIADGSPLTVDVYFSDDLACSATLADVSPVLPELVSTTGSGVYCFGDPIDSIFVDVTGNGPFTIDYTFDGLPMSVTDTSSSISLGNLPGDYVITGISDSGCVNIAMGNETIIEQSVPTVTSIQGGGTYCADSTVADIFVVVTGTAPWDIDYTLNGASMTITGTNDTIIIGNAAGVYNLVGVTDAGCSNVAAGTQTIIVNPLPVVDAGADFISCEGAQIILTATGAQTYVWDNGVVNGVGFVPTVTSDYIVEGTDGNGCIDIDTINVIVEPTPDPSFMADITEGCEPMTVLFTNTTPGNFTDCEWTFGDGNTSIGCADVSNEYLNGGNYTVTLDVTSTNGCTNSVTYDDYIYVEHNPQASFIPSLWTVISLDTEVSFDNTTTGAVTYLWDFGDGSETTTTMDPTHEFPNDQTSGYLVTLYAYSPIGCIDSVTAVIQVNEEVIYYIPNSFTPDGDEFNQTFQPVFTAGYDPYDFNMKIFNRWGGVIYETNNDKVGWDGTFNGKLVQDGVYTWTIEYKTIATDERRVATGHVNVMK